MGFTSVKFSLNMIFFSQFCRMKLCQKLKKYFCYNKHFCLGQNAWKGHRKKIKINMSLNCVGGDGGVGDWQAAKFLGKQAPGHPGI